MRIAPRINPALTFKAWPINPAIFDYPKWKHLIPAVPTHDEFKKAWRELFKYDFDDCTVEYGKQELMGNKLGSGLIVYTPNSTHLIGGFYGYTDEPVLKEEQSFYYPGAGVTWGVDAIGQYFKLIDLSTGLPSHWDEVYSHEIIKRYKPFMINLFN